VVVIGVAIVFMMGRGFDVRPHWIGKAATLLQMITIGVILIKLPHSYVFVWSAGITTVISGIIYVVHGMKKLSA
jgi:phosphatidylglycerophosphate synthase